MGPIYLPNTAIYIKHSKVFITYFIRHHCNYYYNKNIINIYQRIFSQNIEYLTMVIFRFSTYIVFTQSLV